MKKQFVFLLVSLVLTLSVSCSSEKKLEQSESFEVSATSVAVGDNSQNSLDWKGVYKGVVPCADCEGIETTINLKSDGTFRRTLKYIGKEDGLFSDEGTFQWDENGSKIILKDEKPEGQIYLVGENVLYHLDKDGNRITGEMADKYRLPKNPTDFRLEDKKWVLVELQGKPVEKIEGLKEAFIQFEMETGSFHGNGTCNNIFGPYELLEGDRIVFGNIASTMMACQNMETEKTLLSILNQADNYNVSDSSLSLNKAKMAPLARFSLEKIN
jgi:heat shock protein HslJ